MAEHEGTSLRIGRLNLSIPGSGAESGRRVANGVAQNLAQRVPVGVQRGLGALNVRVQVPPDATESRISASIAEAIWKATQRR